MPSLTPPAPLSEPPELPELPPEPSPEPLPEPLSEPLPEPLSSRSVPAAGTPSPVVEPALQRRLDARDAPLPPGFAEARLAREAHKAGTEERRVREGAVHSPRASHMAIRAALAASGLGGAARRNARAVGVTRRALPIAHLPDAFAGLRLLHVSDPHFGADAALDARIVDVAASVEHDVAVLTGDYRYRAAGPIDAAMAGVERLRAVLGDEVLAVLGNHDALAMVPPMEAMGVRVLMNEHATLRRGEVALHVAGVDDPRYYRLDDLGRALAGRSDASAPTLLLAHSPELAAPAAAAGCGAYLCGHTHGGQICLPGGVSVMRNARAPAAHLSGAWRLGDMRGYTSRGAGVSIAVARLFCPPEITLHVLERAVT